MARRKITRVFSREKVHAHTVITDERIVLVRANQQTGREGRWRCFDPKVGFHQKERPSDSTDVRERWRTSAAPGPWREPGARGALSPPRGRRAVKPLAPASLYETPLCDSLATEAAAGRRFRARRDGSAGILEVELLEDRYAGYVKLDELEFADDDDDPRDPATGTADSPPPRRSPSPPRTAPTRSPSSSARSPPPARAIGTNTSGEDAWARGSTAAASCKPRTRPRSPPPPRPRPPRRRASRETPTSSANTASTYPTPRTRSRATSSSSATMDPTRRPRRRTTTNPAVLRLRAPRRPLFPDAARGATTSRCSSPRRSARARGRTPPR